ncbi:MAG: spore cortex biosynthesis protein YabQ [Thermoanaerobacterium sp.]|nr:spore cortex biosynthesis protein YabQ [Thermoanaerobacterium sp.]
MVMNVESQLYSFLVMLYGGIIIAILYDVYKLFRFILRPKRIATDIGDIIYWVLGTIVFIFFLYVSNYAEIRFYSFLGLLIGILLYNIFLSPVVMKILLFFYKHIKNTIIWTYKVVSYPFIVAYKILSIPLRYLSKVIGIPGKLINNTISHFNIFKRKK